MSHRYPLTTPVVLALTALLTFSAQAGRALNVVYDGITYDLEIYTGSYNSSSSAFDKPANGGRMSWWGNDDLANGLARVLAGGLSPFPYPPYGPLFATSLDSSLLGQEVSASFFDLDTLGSSDLVSTAQFDRASQQTYVVESATVPAPVPLVLTAVCLSTTRRLRRLSDRLRQLRVKR